MIDFLKANPSFSMHDYLWGMSYAQVLLASIDFTRVEYNDDNENDDGKTGTKTKGKSRELNTLDDMLSAFGLAGK